MGSLNWVMIGLRMGISFDGLYNILYIRVRHAVASCVSQEELKGQCEGFGRNSPNYDIISA